MAAQFAGSRSLDERRRRRLATATEAQPTSDAPVTASAAVTTPVAADGLLFHVVPGTRRGLVMTFAIAALVVVAAGVGRFAALEWSHAPAGRVGDVLLGSGARALQAFFQSVLLLLAAQLAVIIRWYRGSSRVDYSGSYAIWTPIAVALVLLAAAVQLPIGAAWDAAFRWAVPVDAAWSRVAAAGLIGMLAAPLLPVALRELRPVPAAQGCLILAAGFQVFRLAIGAWPAADARTAHLLEALLFASAIAVPLSVLLGCLCCAQRVMHVSLDPLPKRVGNSWWRRWSKAGQPAAVSAETSAAAAASTGSKELPAEETLAEETPEAVPVAAAAEAAPRKTRRKAKAKPAPLPEVAPEPAPVDEDHEPAAAAEDGDPDELAEQLKGLSKRQRRALRKQRREMERTAA